jgi:hypothetical protein
MWLVLINAGLDPLAYNWVAVKANGRKEINLVVMCVYSLQWSLLESNLERLDNLLSKTEFQKCVT